LSAASLKQPAKRNNDFAQAWDALEAILRGTVGERGFALAGQAFAMIIVSLCSTDNGSTHPWLNSLSLYLRMQIVSRNHLHKCVPF